MSVRNRVTIVLALLLAISAACFAQEGSITGSVHDSSGAVIPNATVNVTSIEQGWVRTVHTNSTGDYLVPALPAGSYNIQVESTGFERYEVKALILRVAEKSRADATLTVGQLSTEVSVAGSNVAQVQTESAELSGVVTNKQIDQLVLNGRNFTQLITLIPGVSNQTGQDEGTVGVYGSVAFSVNGGRTEYNNWELDGGDNMDNGSNGTLNTYPNVDAIAEVKVLTSNYGAQYGAMVPPPLKPSPNRAPTISTATFSNSSATKISTPATSSSRFQSRNTSKNDYGYTIGGPVFIPKLYNTSRQKTFFFFSEDWRKELVPGTVFNQQVPSTTERSGNFSQDCPAAGSPVDTTNFPNCPVNPSTSAYYPVTKFRSTPQAQTLLPLIPSANTSTGFFNASPAQHTNWREELVRVDENITDKHRFFFASSTIPGAQSTPRLCGAPAASRPLEPTSWARASAWSPILLPRFRRPPLNEFMFSYTTDHIFLTATPNPTRPSSFDMPGIFDNGYRGILPNVTIQDTAEYGGGF